MPLRPLRWLLDVPRVEIKDFLARANEMQPRADAGPVERGYFAHSGTVVSKWHHYLPLYDRYFAPYRARSPLRLLEIGVFQGGSLALWREFFGPGAIIFGVDIDTRCEAFDNTHGNHVRIGSQIDAAFLNDVVAEMGGVDIVVDDGSHLADHMTRTFDILFPLLSQGGLYVVEDTHTNYWTKFNGGYRRRSTFIERTKTLIDDVHHWWHRKGQKTRSARDMVSGIHVHELDDRDREEQDRPARYEPRRNQIVLKIVRAEKWSNSIFRKIPASPKVRLGPSLRVRRRRARTASIAGIRRTARTRTSIRTTSTQKSAGR